MKLSDLEGGGREEIVRRVDDCNPKRFRALAMNGHERGVHGRRQLVAEAEPITVEECFRPGSEGGGPSQATGQGTEFMQDADQESLFARKTQRVRDGLRGLTDAGSVAGEPSEAAVILPGRTGSGEGFKQAVRGEAGDTLFQPNRYLLGAAEIIAEEREEMQQSARIFADQEACGAQIEHGLLYQELQTEQGAGEHGDDRKGRQGGLADGALGSSRCAVWGQHGRCVCRMGAYGFPGGG